MSSEFYYKMVLNASGQHPAFNSYLKDFDLVNSTLPIRKFLEEISAAQRTDKELAKLDHNELLVVKLLDYFKNNFFTWVDAIECENCNGKKCSLFDVYNSNQATLEEISNNVSTIEIYKCDDCKKTYRFPRYNNPKRLLQTRKGRCGEWANCFAFILHCLNIQTRIVYCSTDHVWVEFYNQTERRWIHADPCENVIDNELLYQHGWGKVIDLVIARGEFEVRDVTWRYTGKWIETCNDRKKKFDEKKLADIFNSCNSSIQKNLSSSQRKQLTEMWLAELVEFIRMPGQEVILPKKATSGRLSGSIAWRMSRAEIGNSSGSDCSKFNFTLKPQFHKTVFAYDCKTDQYIVKYDPESTTNHTCFQKWNTCVAQSCNIFRNVENDWKMCYLARHKDTNQDDLGSIVWKFATSQVEKDPLEQCWFKIEILICGETFQSGKVELEIKFSELDCKIGFKLNEKLTITWSDVRKMFQEKNMKPTSSTFEIVAKLTGGNGDVAWQHAQLFRQSTRMQQPNDTSQTFPFNVNVFYY